MISCPSPSNKVYTLPSVSRGEEKTIISQSFKKITVATPLYVWSENKAKIIAMMKVLVRLNNYYAQFSKAHTYTQAGCSQSYRYQVYNSNE